MLFAVQAVRNAQQTPVAYTLVMHIPSPSLGRPDFSAFLATLPPTSLPILHQQPLPEHSRAQLTLSKGGHGQPVPYNTMEVAPFSPFVKASRHGASADAGPSPLVALHRKSDRSALSANPAGLASLAVVSQATGSTAQQEGSVLADNTGHGLSLAQQLLAGGGQAEPLFAAGGDLVASSLTAGGPLPPAVWEQQQQQQQLGVDASAHSWQEGAATASMGDFMPSERGARMVSRTPVHSKRSFVRACEQGVSPW